MTERRRRAGFLEVQAESLARLAAEPLPPLLVITGDDAFLKERLVAAARERVGGEDEVFAARPEEPDAVAFRRMVDQWCTASLFHSGQIVIARQADALLKAGSVTELAERLDNGPPNHLLITLGALDGRSKLARSLKAAGALVALPPLRDSPPPWEAQRGRADTELNAWVRAEAELRDLALDVAGSDALTRRIGNEPANLARKLDQLAVLVGDRGRITSADVARHVRHTSARLLTLFEDALRAGDVAEALTLLDRMNGEGVYDHAMRLVSGAEAADTMLRGLAGNLARVLAAHEQLTPALRSALDAKPWQRAPADAAALDAVLGAGGRRVFLERDVRATGLAGVTRAFRLSVAGLRALRDGAGLSMHATTVRLARALADRSPSAPGARR